jgi:pimeloyl-ACP methyl ester carboxylesterase
MKPGKTFDIRGHDGRKIANTLWKSDAEEPVGCAVILPGFLYPAEAPLTFYLKMLFCRHGWDVLSIDYRYNENRDFLSLDDSGRSSYFSEEQHLIADYIDAHLSYERYVFVGKSIGTTSAYELLDSRAQDFISRVCGAVWLTPAHKNHDIVELIESESIPSVYVIGKNDPFYDASLIEQLDELEQVSLEVVPNAGHLLEDEESTEQSVENVKRVVSRVQNALTQGVFRY